MQIISEDMHNHCAYFPPVIYIVWRTFAAQKKEVLFMKKNVSIFVLTGFCLLSCHQDIKQKPVLHHVALTTPIKNGDVTTKHFSGFVKESEEISVGFRVGGVIEKLAVKEGDFVRQGQVIASLDSKDFQLNLDAAQIQYEQTQKEVGRMERMYQQNGMSGNDYEKALAGLEQLRIQLEQSKLNCEYTVLRAPVSGYIQQVNFRAGEMIGAGTAVVTLLDVNHFEVETDIPASLYIRQADFSGFDCVSSQWPDKRFDLKWISINQKSNGNQLYKVKFALPHEAQSVLTAGMNVEVNIHIQNNETVRNTFVVPESSVFQSEDGNSFVWLFNADSTVSRREVVVDCMLPGGDLQIRQGLNGDERIVKAGVKALVEHEKVGVIETPSETNVGGII